MKKLKVLLPIVALTVLCSAIVGLTIKLSAPKDVFGTGVTILHWNLTDPLGTARTNINTSLDNLNNGVASSSYNFTASGSGLSVATSGTTVTYTYSSSSLNLGSFLTTSTNLGIKNFATTSISQWANDSGFITTSTGLTVSNLATSSISQFANDAGYLTTSTSGGTLLSCTARIINATSGTQSVDDTGCLWVYSGNAFNITNATNTTGLLANWRMNDVTSTILTDYLGVANGVSKNAISGMATSSGNPPYMNGALYFNGSSDYVTVTSTVDLHPLNNMTVSVWIKTTATNNNIISDTNDFEIGIGSYAATAGHFMFWTPGDGMKQANTAVNDGNWHHIALVASTTLITFYNNGVADGTSTLVGTFTTSTTNLGIGASPTGGAKYTGYLDSLRYYNRAVTANEIASLYNSGNGMEFGAQRFEFDLPTLASSSNRIYTFKNRGSGVPISVYATSTNFIYNVNSTSTSFSLAIGSSTQMQNDGEYWDILWSR